MFSNPKNFTIEAGTFTNFGGDTINVQGNLLYGDGEPPGLKSLRQVASLGAIHDSSERYPPPSCHAETRLEVRRIMLDWTKDKNTTSSMLWLYGSVGVGKSAIMQSVAEQLALEQGDLGVATFFFSAGKGDRNQGKFLVPTVAYQLALNVPELHSHINSAMVLNPTLHTKAIPVQMQHLIVGPFKKLAAPLQIIPTVLVDGLDECENHDIQKLIITLIGEALIKHRLPIRFVVASRPEAHIREAFDTAQLCSITHRIPLDDSFQASRDIKKYLEDGFRDIHQQKAHVMTQVATPWPEEGVIDLLVQKASGQFIYAATVLKFVGAEYCRPTAQLAIVLKPRPSSAKPFAELDHLYHQILSSHNDPKTLVLILGILVTVWDNQPPEVIEDILGMEAGELGLVLRGLHSVIDFPQSPVDGSIGGAGSSNEERGLRFFHASFREYLVNHERSGPFFIDEERSSVNVVFLFFELLGKCISQSCREGLNQRLRPATWGRLRQRLPFYFSFCNGEACHRVINLIRSAIDELGNQDSLPQMQLFALHCATNFIMSHISDTRKTGDSWPQPHLRRLMPYDRTNPPPEERERLDGVDEALDEKVIEALRRLHSILDRHYDFMLSSSPDVNAFILSVPGFFAMEYSLSLSDMAQILDVDVVLLESYVEQNKCFMNSQSQKPGSIFDWHFVQYLCDQRRSGTRHHDGRVDCIFLCKRSIHLSIQLECHWSRFDRCGEVTQEFFKHNVGTFLKAIRILPTDSTDHPLWPFADYLEDILFPNADLERAYFECLERIWNHALNILMWVQEQQQLIREMKTTLHVEFERKLDSITDKIFQQILYVETTFDGPVVTVYPTFVPVIQRGVPSWWHIDRLKLTPSIMISPVNEAYTTTLPRLSTSILSLNSQYPRLSLEQYLTSPIRAKGMYINKDCFQTQLFEVWLDLVLAHSSKSEWYSSLSHGPVRYKPHLIGASGTEKIFARLRLPELWSSTPTFSLVSGVLRADIFREIITWLESLDKPPLDIYLKYQLMLLGDEEIQERERQESIQSQVIVSPKSEAQPVVDTTLSVSTSSTMPIGQPTWKHVLQGIGDLYFWFALFLCGYLHLVFYWRRRYLE